MEPSEVTLQPAHAKDCDYVFALQSTPGIRQFFVNPHIPTRQEHETWFQGMLDNPATTLFMVHYNQQRAGIVRLDVLHGEKHEVSIIIDPHWGGKGIGKKALFALLQQHPDVEIHATIHQNNHPSLKLFEQCGFIRTSSNTSEPFLTFVHPPQKGI